MSKKCTILYVDDEPLNLDLFEINLHDSFIVLTAISGDDGLKLLQQKPEICVVVSDMKMPGMNGLEFIDKAKENRPDICYFILTGYGITNEIKEAINNRTIIKYFQKPFDLTEIETSINNALKK